MRKKAVEIVPTWNKNLEMGATLEGYFVKKEIYQSKFGPTEKYIIEKPDKTRVAVYSSASLQSQFSNIPELSYVWIAYKGEETSKSGRPVKAFDIDYDDELKYQA